MKTSMTEMSKKLEQYECADRPGPPNTTARPPPLPAPRQGQLPRLQQSAPIAPHVDTRPPQGQPYGQQETVRPPLICWTCEEPGHMSRQCRRSAVRDHRRHHLSGLFCNSNRTLLAMIAPCNLFSSIRRLIKDRVSTGHQVSQGATSGQQLGICPAPQPI